MSFEVSGTFIKTDEEGYLLNPKDWTEEVMEVLIEEHEKEGHRPVGVLGRAMIFYFRDFYEDHLRHPTMREMIKFHAKKKGISFQEAEKLRDLLYERFPHGPIPKLVKLAGLPKAAVAQEIEGG